MQVSWLNSTESQLKNIPHTFEIILNPLVPPDINEAMQPRHLSHNMKLQPLKTAEICTLET